MDIDSIMELISMNNSKEAQSCGIELARKIECFNVFFQPNNPHYNKNVWDNCALIISEKTDDELVPYLSKMFEWLMDLNWPGAEIIMDRIRKLNKSPMFYLVWNNCKKCAIALEDEIWLRNLEEIFIDSN